MSQPSNDASARHPRVIAFLNQKGGVGKTTSTVNIGAALAEMGKRVCLIDMDPQGHLSLHLGLDGESVGDTVYELLLEPDVPLDQAPREQAIVGGVSIHGQGIHKPMLKVGLILKTVNGKNFLIKVFSDLVEKVGSFLNFSLSNSRAEENKIER